VLTAQRCTRTSAGRLLLSSAPLVLLRVHTFLARRGKLTELMADHSRAHLDGDVLLACVHLETLADHLVSDELWAEIPAAFFCTISSLPPLLQPRADLESSDEFTSTTERACPHW